MKGGNEHVTNLLDQNNVWDKCHIIVIYIWPTPEQENKRLQDHPNNFKFVSLCTQKTFNESKFDHVIMTCTMTNL